MRCRSKFFPNLIFLIHANCWNKERDYVLLCLCLFLSHDCINLDYEWSFLLRKAFFKIYNKTDLNFCHQKSLFYFFIFFIYDKTDLNFCHHKTLFFTSHKADMIFWQIKIIFFLTIKTNLIFYQKKRFHPHINL